MRGEEEGCTVSPFMRMRQKVPTTLRAPDVPISIGCVTLIGTRLRTVATMAAATATCDMSTCMTPIEGTWFLMSHDLIQVGRDNQLRDL